MKFRKLEYQLLPDGSHTESESEVELDNEQTRRMEAMASARPGAIVLGWNSEKEGVTVSEGEKYLED